MRLTRRQFLRLSGAAAALAVPSFLGYDLYRAGQGEAPPSVSPYAPSGVLIDQWQTIGSIRLVAPVGVYFDDSSSRLYVTDVGAHQVHIFRVEVVSED